MDRPPIVSTAAPRSERQLRAEATVCVVLRQLVASGGPTSSSSRVVASGARKAALAAQRAELSASGLLTDLARPPNPRTPGYVAPQERLCMSLSHELDDPGFLLLASSSDDEDARDSPAEDRPPSPRSRSATPAPSIGESPGQQHGAAVATQDIWQLVFGTLSCAELCRICAPVCRTWRDAAKGAAQWESFDVDTAGTAGRVLLVDEETVLPSLACWVRGRARSLRLSTADVGDRGLAALLDTARPAVRSLDLSFCTRLTDGGLAPLRDLPHLAKLNLDGVHRLSNTGLCDLARAVVGSLRELSLDGESLTDRWLEQMLSSLPLLDALEISFCEALTDASLASLTRHKCNQRPWRKLALRKGFAFTDGAMMELLSAGPKKVSAGDDATDGGGGLEELDLAECHALGDLTGSSIGLNCPRLHTLVLSWCWGISDASALSVVSGCPNLVALRLVGLKGLTTGALSALPMCCPNLLELDVRQCDYCEDDALGAISAGMDERNAGNGRPRLVVRNYYGEVLRLASPRREGRAG